MGCRYTPWNRVRQARMLISRLNLVECVFAYCIGIKKRRGWRELEIVVWGFCFSSHIRMKAIVEGTIFWRMLMQKFERFRIGKREFTDCVEFVTSYPAEWFRFMKKKFHKNFSPILKKWFRWRLFEFRYSSAKFRLWKLYSFFPISN